jgi:hypothetical protein
MRKRHSTRGEQVTSAAGEYELSARTAGVGASSHSGLMPDVLITLPHLSTSAAM